jgi:hypothetical protein
MLVVWAYTASIMRRAGRWLDEQSAAAQAAGLFTNASLARAFDGAERVFVATLLGIHSAARYGCWLIALSETLAVRVAMQGTRLGRLKTNR